MKRSHKITLIILTVAIIASQGLLLLQNYAKQQADKQQKSDQQQQIMTDAKKFKQEYSEVADNNAFRYKSVEQIIKTLESGTGLVYLGFPECPWCQKYVKYLDETSRELGLKEISYYNIKQIRQDNTAEYQKIINLLKNHQLNTDKNGQPRIFVPEIVAVKNGKIIGRDNTTSLNSTAKDGTPTEWWTTERIKQIKAKLGDLIREIETCQETCN